MDTLEEDADTLDWIIGHIGRRFQTHWMCIFAHFDEDLDALDEDLDTLDVDFF